MSPITSRKILLGAAAAFSVGALLGCAGREFAPKDPYPYWYYPKELPAADRALKAAREAGKDRECPPEFGAVEDLVNKAYKVYADCRDDEAIAAAREATAKAKALCPLKPAPAAMPESRPVPETKPEPGPVPAKPGQKAVMLEDVHFEFDKADLTPEAKETLKRHIRSLKDNPVARVGIEGHACQHGPKKYNIRLSKKRADAVREFLVKEGGIAADRLAVNAYGKAMPLFEQKPTPKNKDSKEMKANRRVHFEVMN